MKKSLIILPILMLILGFALQNPIRKEDSVATTLFALGLPKPDHYIANITDENVKMGEELVKMGRTTRDGSTTPYISKYYACTSCHNVSREDPDLRVVDADARLQWAMENKLPYLQGSTFWGIVNRETWYNDDYVLKYGDLVRKAEKSLKESVQLCAQVCAAGRPVEDWEMNAILSYLWSLEMKMGDLDLNAAEWESINNPATEPAQVKALIQSKFLAKSPATFSDLPRDKREGYPYTGRPELGKAIFELGCMHCHRPQGESDVVFDTNKLTLKWLKRHITDHGDLSIYQIVRKGTYSEYGHQEYMPHYTQEKMSDQQLEDLRAFIEQGI